MLRTKKCQGRFGPYIALLAGPLMLAACGGDQLSSPPPTPAPTPTPTAVAGTFDVVRCLSQTIPGMGGMTVAGAVVPDTVKIDFSRGAGFPNGRLPSDPVVDMTLAVIFLDMTKHDPNALVALPLNPLGNDKPLSTTFPFLASPHGAPPLSPGTATSFTFRTNAASEYTRVDRMGMPAVATALVGSSRKNIYNEANPADDSDGVFVPEFIVQLTNLTNALRDDFVAQGFTPCSTAN